jgi:pyridoxamine 5'-phosphate oxidase family protein
MRATKTRLGETDTMATSGLGDLELAYLRKQRIGRLATVDTQGRPQASPVVFFLREDGTIDIGGRAMGTTRKWRNLAANQNIALVIDDIASVNPWVVRGVEIRGTAEQVVGAHDLPDFLSPELIRIHPTWVHSWGLEG